MKKGEHTDERGIIITQVGIECAKKRLIRFDNDDKMAFHVKSLDIGEK